MADELKALANKAVAKADWARAIQHLSEAIALAPSDATCFSNRAFALSSSGRHEEALADARQSMALAPNMSKGYLRAGRALVGLGRREDAIELLEDAADNRFPQDYALQEALESALSLPSAGAADGMLRPLVNDPSAGETGDASEVPATTHSGLASSYYYAAVPASQRSLPVAAPQRIEPTAARQSTASAHGHAAGGAVRADIERKGSDSYYYAHDRSTDFVVPTVPKKLNSDGSLTPWDGK